MNPLITLATLTGPQDRSPSTVPVRPMQARDLPELMLVNPQAYAEGSAHLHGGNHGGITDLFDGVLGLPVAEVSLVTATPHGRFTHAIITTDTTLAGEKSTAAFTAERFTDPAHRRHGPDEGPRHPEGTGPAALGPPHNTTGRGRADHDPAQAHSGSQSLKRGSD